MVAGLTRPLRPRTKAHNELRNSMCIFINMSKLCNMFEVINNRCLNYAACFNIYI